MVEISITHTRRSRAGTVCTMFGLFLLFTCAISGYMAYLSSSKWHRLHENGTKVVGVVSEKHRIDSEPDIDGDTRSYRRVFFQPLPSLQAEVMDLWKQTSVATRYPDSVTLFDDWGNRLWSDYSSDEFAEIVVGQEVEILIDGEESLVFYDGGPPSQGWVVSGVAGAIGLILIVYGAMRRRRANLPAAGETVWDAHGDGSS